MSGRVLFYVQHLLGVGHVRRAAALSRAMRKQNLDVTVAFGGFPVALADFGGAKLHQLAPCRTADMSFSALLDEGGNAVDDAWWDKRREALLALCERTAPDVILTEHFPFGRGQFKKELIPLMQAAKGRARMACSVRDVLVAKDNEAKTEKIIALIERYFDHILVHGVESIIPFEATFAPARRFAHKITYTGYIAGPEPEAAADRQAGRGEIIVSTGGGAVGADLLRAGLEVAAQERFGRYRWRFLAGDNLDRAVRRDLEARAPVNAIIEPARADFKTLLANCALSISQGGYNTVMDVIAARCRNLIVPFATTSESEQSFRAARFDDLGLVNLFRGGELGAQSLGDAAMAALKTRVPGGAKPDMNGAEEAARLISNMAGAGK